jgi:hypothetical protein
MIWDQVLEQEYVVVMIVEVSRYWRSGLVGGYTNTLCKDSLNFNYNRSIFIPFDTHAS